MIKSDLEFRIAKPEELSTLVDVENKSWPPNQRFSKENFENQLKTFPNGMITAFQNGRMVGMFVLNRVDYDSLKDKSWVGISDNGNLSGVFNPDGPDLYGVSLTVLPSARMMGVGGALVQEALEMGRRLGVKRFILGSRMPEYCKQKGLKPEEYLALGTDPLVNFYKKNGLKEFHILPDYFDDPESLDYGLLMGRIYET